jgi:hypothetical protein
MTKDLFLFTIEALRLQRKIDENCSKAFEIILPSAFIDGYDNSVLVNQLTLILRVQLDDEGRDSWINYYIDYLNFGTKYKPGCAKYKNGKNIDLSTPEKLYDFLVKEMELKK